MTARYFMNLRYRDRYYRDREGDELDGEDAVRRHVFKTADELIRLTRTNIIHDWYACTFEVTDESGAVVLIFPFGETVPELDSAAEE